MSEWIEKLSFDSIVTLPMIARVLSAALVLVIGWIAARLASRGIRKMIATRATRQPRAVESGPSTAPVPSRSARRNVALSPSSVTSARWQCRQGSSFLSISWPISLT